MRRALAPLIRAIGGPIGGLGATLLRLSGRRQGFALLYHAVAESMQAPDDDVVPPHPPSVFAGQVRHARRWYRVVDAAELLDAVRSRRRWQRFPVAITFDDDLRTHVEAALPVLREAGARATFFLCGASLDRPFAFWWERLQAAFEGEPAATTEIVRARARQPLLESPSIRDLARSIEDMTVEDRRAVARELAELAGPDPEQSGIRRRDVRELADAGMAIGFHTLRHDPLDSLDDARLTDALRTGRRELEEVVGGELTTIAYPHGRTNARVAQAARAAGFAGGFSASGFPARASDDPHLVPRITPSHKSAGHLAVHLVLTLLSPPVRRET